MCGNPIDAVGDAIGSGADAVGPAIEQAGHAIGHAMGDNDSVAHGDAGQASVANHINHDVDGATRGSSSQALGGFMSQFDAIGTGDCGWLGSDDTGGVNWHAVEQAVLQRPIHLPLHDSGGPVPTNTIISVGGNGNGPRHG